MSSLIRAKLRSDVRSRWEAINGTRKVNGASPRNVRPRSLNHRRKYQDRAPERVPESARSMTGHVLHVPTLVRAPPRDLFRRVSTLSAYSGLFDKGEERQAEITHASPFLPAVPRFTLRTKSLIP